MPPVPKKKHTRARAGKRRKDKKLSLPNLTVCKSCGNKKHSHEACPACGKE